MKKLLGFFFLLVFVFACSRKEIDISERVAMYAPIEMKTDISYLTPSEQNVVLKLVEVAKIADQIFWKQTSPDALSIYKDLKNINSDFQKYLRINYGPYDAIFEWERFYGKGLDKRPKGGNLYPEDITKKEFEDYVNLHPEQKDALESQYTVVVRKEGKLEGVFYHEAYPEVKLMVQKLKEAAAYTQDKALKKYLILLSDALLKDTYFESDMAWMDVKDGNIDLVIGPIENYIDELFNYKTAFEGGIFVKDHEGTQKLQIYRSHIKNFEKNLPYDKNDQKYIRTEIQGDNNILEIVNAVYLGGDFNQGIKTIATSLPNDPKVHEAKGAKKIMFKNLIEAKFDKIVDPIAKTLLDEKYHNLINKKSFLDFITLHEVSHTLGRGYVYGNDKLTVRKALKERYSAIEEAKADILSIYNHKYLKQVNVYTEEENQKAMATFIAGLFRSVRFGVEEAHGKANLIQLNYLKEKGVLKKNSKNKYEIDSEKFFTVLGDLAKLVLTTQATGNYDQAGEIINRYGNLDSETKRDIESLKTIPRDIDTIYNI